MQTQESEEDKRQKPLVLVVEDAGIQVRLLQMSLERANYRVLAVGDGREALAQVAAHHPDVILLDIDIPGLNGFQVLERLRKDPESKGIPVVMLTAHAKDAVLFEECSAPGDAFMTKPYSPHELVSTLQRIVAAPAATP